MKLAKIILPWVIAIAIFGGALWAVIYAVESANRYSDQKHHERIEAAKPLAHFEIISGPDEIGYNEFFVVRHKQTGTRWVLVQRGSGGIFLAPFHAP